MDGETRHVFVRSRQSAKWLSEKESSTCLLGKKLVMVTYFGEKLFRGRSVENHVDSIGNVTRVVLLDNIYRSLKSESDNGTNCCKLKVVTRSNGLVG